MSTKRMFLITFLVAIVVGGALSVAGTFVAKDVREETRHRTAANMERIKDNRLLLKFSCGLSLAVAKRLDTLVKIRLEAGTLQPSEKGTFEKYHRDYQRGKNICPPISKAENKRIATLLTELGGKLPTQP